MSDKPCGCCEGVDILTPQTTANRPGLDALAYRAGTHATFLETMLARLSSADYPALAGLTTRDPGDPAIAFLDAWALVGDVLTFYQERIANEGYLLTAAERRSILELARLVGYRLRPGVAASVFLAFDLEQGAEVEIPAGTRAQSLPGPGELPQPFETAEPLLARAAWNALKPRLTRPQVITLIGRMVVANPIYLEGITTNLKPNDPLLFVFDPNGCQGAFDKVKSIEVDAELNRTRVVLQNALSRRMSNPDLVSGSSRTQGLTVGGLTDLLTPLLKPPSIQPANALRLIRKAEATFAAESDAIPRLLTTFKPRLRDGLYKAWANTTVTGPEDGQRLQRLEALRVKAAPFGHNAPLKPIYDDEGAVVGSEEWPLAGTLTTGVEFVQSVPFASLGEMHFLVTTAALAPPVVRVFARQGSTEISRRVQLPDESAIWREHVTDLGAHEVALSIICPPRLRFETAAFGTPELDILLDGEPVLLWEYRYTSLPVGEHYIQVREADAPDDPALIEKTLSMAEDEAYTVLINGKERELSLQLVRDQVPPPEEDWAAVRVIHAAFITPNAVKISAGEQTIASGLEYGDVSDFHLVEAGELQATVDYEGTEVPVQLNLESGRICDILLCNTAEADLAPQVELLRISYRDFLGDDLRRLTFCWEYRICRNQPYESIRTLRLGSSEEFLTGQVPELSIVAQFGNGESLVRQIDYGQTLRETVDGHKIYLGFEETFLASDEYATPLPDAEWDVLSLDAEYDHITPGSCLVVERPPEGSPNESGQIITQVEEVKTVTRADYGITAQVTQLRLQDQWLTAEDQLLGVVRNTTVYAQGEELALAEAPIETLVHPNPVAGDRIEMDGLYDGLEPGRWLIVSGERTDVTDGQGNPIPEFPGAELVMLAAVEQDVSEDLVGDRPHTTLILANSLEYTYKRDTVTIYGNVVKATHGETREEVLGSGDGSQGRQQFTLKQSPLTYLAAPTPAGAESTLQVRVNDVLWHESERMVDLEPDDRAYSTRTDDENKTTVLFGDGKHGARLPTGVENLRAVYRTGIGRPGNVPAEQISLLATRPLGVKGVNNPLPATGGADRESRDQARRNVPLAILALDRLVSVQDYADFCRTYAGIAKASAARLSDGRRELVHLTIAGVDDIPIEPTSDLYRNLRRALRRYGDPRLAVQIDLRELMLLVIRARVRLHPDYLWESVAPKIRAALLDALGFDRRELGQDVLLAEVIAVIQGVPGVTYVDVELLESISESEAEDEELLSAKLAELAAAGGAGGNGAGAQPRPRIHVASRPGQLAILSPKIPETLYLEEIIP